MRIIKVTWQHRYDFVADMECEHCGYRGELTTGYEDNFFHDKVIPAMLCSKCGKNRSGGTETKNPEVGVMII